MLFCSSNAFFKNIYYLCPKIHFYYYIHYLGANQTVVPETNSPRPLQKFIRHYKI